MNGLNVKTVYDEINNKSVIRLHKIVNYKTCDK